MCSMLTNTIYYSDVEGCGGCLQLNPMSCNPMQCVAWVQVSTASTWVCCKGVASLSVLPFGRCCCCLELESVGAGCEGNPDF
jgi:hypothetical protein